MAKTSEYETYEYDSYASEVIKGLDELRKAGISCDAVLQTMDGERFQVHQNVLMAVSPYFRVMFTGGFKEAQNNTENATVLPTISSVGLKPVLDCLYSGKLLLTPETVYDVLPAAHMLQLTNILGSCTTFLTKKMSTATCFQNLGLSEKYDLNEVNEASECFILNNFAELSTSTEFKEMSDVSLCEYLKHPKLKGSEIGIFRAVKEWLEYESNKNVHLTEVMSLINFKAIPVDELADDVMKYEPLKSDAECFEMALEAVKYHSNVFSQPFKSSSTLRGQDTIVSFAVSEGGNSVEPSVHIDALKLSDLHLERNKPSKDTILKCNLALGSLNLVKVDNFIYLFGTDGKTFTSVVKRYDGTMGVWIDLASPPTLGARGSAAAYTSGTIMLVGGVLANGNTVDMVTRSTLIDTSLCYIVEHNQWNRVKNCPIPTAYHSICAHKGLVYVAGGYVCDGPFVQHCTRLFAYDSKADLWLSKANMNAARAGAVLEAVNDKLFVLGGGNMLGIGSSVATASVEMYDIETNQWTTVLESDPGSLMYGSSSFVDGKSIYLTGGCNVDANANSNSIFMFNTVSMDITSVKATLRYNPCRHASVVIRMHND